MDGVREAWLRAKEQLQPSGLDLALDEAKARVQRGTVSFSDDDIAWSFTDRHHAHLLYVPEWGHWLRWDGARWAKDKTLAVYDMVRRVCREHAHAAQFEGKAGNEKGLAIASAQKVAAVERMARSDPRHVREAELFDADPWALNTPGGVVDLRTGELRPHRQSDHFTKVTGSTPAGTCPRWLRFLDEITQGDATVVAYLQRWAGYILTGTTREHAFLVPHGPGGNGKGVMVNTLAGVMGDYATTAPMETFMASQHDRHPTDLAGLRGARLVVAQETEAGRVLAEARVKALTGGDKIAARFMRGDFFEFTPVFKLVMVGNHRPVIRNPDDAMRRRLHLLPLTFKPTHPDHTLPERLKEEMPGILAWAVQGCLAWQREGLGMPEIVRDTTADYFAEQDLLGQWLAERCKIEPATLTASAALFRDWSAWTKDRGENPGTNKAFSAAMEQHHAKRRTREGAMFVGVRLLPSDRGVV
ncbi:phage/plasmid primase, P4 family [Sediminicoccus rosea]|uniref:Phage/plasmid primase, P4 family n=1 Tax=Sediminicoccus rosea TaxID=1225128 RepID=A0ABZ0PBM4_9PROT|nr:phage/plasmid primase, P4 family [Sediminicoccus rosea]WPB83098.1 phage/plasmid primase, P4 family [Sediminicoccus rosea]